MVEITIDFQFTVTRTEPARNRKCRQLNHVQYCRPHVAYQGKKSLTAGRKQYILKAIKNATLSLDLILMQYMVLSTKTAYTCTL